MKKVLVVVAVIALVVWVISWFRAPDAVATSAAKPWPGGLGTLDSAVKRFPPQQSNDGAKKLMALGGKLPKSEAVDAFVRREVQRADVTIGEPPALADVSAVRDLLLREPIVWERRGGIGGGDDTQTRRGVQMTVARALVATALTKARANDPAGWEDLHAVWKLARTLDGHPQMLFQTAALSMARMINGVAWKMPLPAPAWLAEVQTRDNVRPLLEGFQYLVADYGRPGEQLFPTKFDADQVEFDRAIAVELSRTTTCDVNTRMNKLGTDLSVVWHRAFRYRAEREASANALRIRTGQPIETKSVCSDGTWSFDGTTLRFSRAIAPAGEIDLAMPLELRPKP
jgi:hypothetical protein